VPLGVFVFHCVSRARKSQAHVAASCRGRYLAAKKMRSGKGEGGGGIEGRVWEGGKGMGREGREGGMSREGVSKELNARARCICTRSPLQDIRDYTHKQSESERERERESMWPHPQDLRDHTRTHTNTHTHV
jgi:hypothetical protein